MKTARGWRRILDLPPIDWALLAAERSLKGRKATPAQIAKQRAGIAKARKAKRKAAKRRALERLATVNASRRGTPGAGAAFLAAFEPGHWYGLSDIARLSGVKLGSCKSYVNRFRHSGQIERTQNPAFVRRGGLECEFLYRRVMDLNPQVHDDVGNQRQGADEAEEQ